MTRKIIALLLISFFFSCAKKAEESEEIVLETKMDTANSVTGIQDLEEENLTYSIAVEEIDSAAFIKAKNSAPKQKSIEKNTDFKTAKKLLAGIVEFEPVDGSERYQEVKKVYFRNGKKLENRNDFDGETFVAYFPSEDILLCEGGHTSDMSFNLKNGKRTEETGNPDVISASPKNNFRLNGYFGGQQCFSYFIQKNVNGEFQNILQVDEEFKKITGHWLCIIGDAFWVDEKTLYVSETSNFDENAKPMKLYFKISLR